MPAQSKKQVYAFEDAFETAAAGVMKAAGFYDSLISGANETLPESRIEIMFVLGETLNEAVLINGQHVYDYFNASLRLKLVTVRPRDQPSLLPGVSNLHAEWLGGIRTAFEERVRPFNETNLPWYKVNTIRSSGSARDFDARWFEDFSTLSFLIEFGIRSDAWPL